jgi:hypothetical protein
MLLAVLAELRAWKKHELPGPLQALSFLTRRLRRSGMPLVDVVDNTRGANKAAENATLVHDRRPPLLVDAEALRVKRALAADLATNELAAR